MKRDTLPAPGAGLQRRDFLGLHALLLAGCAVPGLAHGELLADLERRSFDFFWERSDAATGLVPDRWPTPSFASVAAMGFALSAYPIGVERGWVTRAQAAERVLTTLRFLYQGRQGPEPTGCIGHRGFFYHFLDMQSGTRFRDVELSTIDTALLISGALHCAAWFDDTGAAETEIRHLAEALYARVDWPWAQVRPPSIGHGWTPERGHIAADYKGYNEAMLLYLLALGSPTHPVAPEAWRAWTEPYAAAWGTEWGQTYLRYPTLFTHQFSHAWIDFRGLQDGFMRERGIDYFENTRRATLAQRAYATANPEGWAGYGPDAWGQTACDGPADVQREFGGKLRRFISYAGRGLGGAVNHDDGTLAPYAAASSLPFTLEVAASALRHMHARWGHEIYGRYGFFAFNPSFTFSDVKLTHGRIAPGVGWVDTDWLGIEVGPQLMMLANHRSDSVWKPLRGNPHLTRGLKRAGFTGGWLEAA